MINLGRQNLPGFNPAKQMYFRPCVDYAQKCFQSVEVELLKFHKSSKLYISMEKEREGQYMFKKDGDNELSLKGTQITLSKKELIRKTEIIRALTCIKSSHLFSSTSDDGKIFKEIFPVLEIAISTR